VKRLIFLLLLIPQICFAQMIVQNRDIKQHPATKLFISGNHLVSDFEDASASNNQITKYADAKTVNETSATNPKYFPVGNDKGIYFDGTGDLLSIADNADLEIGSDNYTIDFWYLTNSLVAGGTTKQILGKYITTGNQKEYFIHLDENEKIVAGYTTNGSTDITMISANAVTLNTWYHISFVHNGSELYLFVNGILQETDTGVATVFAGTAALTIAAYNGATTGNHSGFLQNIRFTKGEALWTSNFTPPALNSTYETTANTKLYIKGHDKAVNTTVMTDDSGTNKTITTNGDTKVGYSRGVASYFDGTGDYIKTPITTDANFGSNDFTISTWFMPTTNPAINNGNIQTIISKYDSSGTNRSYILYYRNNGTSTYLLEFEYSTNGSSGIFLTQSGRLTLNRWYHIAVIRSSDTISLYVDGALRDHDDGVGGLYDNSKQVLIGAYYNSSPTISTISYLPGYISNLKIKNGYADYTDTFTPPETEPVADQYTKLLLKQKMLKIPDIATNKTITINGQTMNRNFAKVGKNSIYFDGSGDYITSALSTDTDMGTGSFTIDFWIYSNTPASNCHIGGINDNANANGGGVHFVTTPQLYARINSATFDLIDSTYTGEKWNHVALVRNGNSWNLYVNGISKANATNSLSLTYAGTGIVLGRRMYDTTQQFKGYIQDFRVTKGKALWTSNFTPPRRSGAF